MVVIGPTKHFPGQTRCVQCDSTYTLTHEPKNKSFSPHLWWYRVDGPRGGGYLCNTCWMKRAYTKLRQERRAKRADLAKHHYPGQTICNLCNTTVTAINHQNNNARWYFLNRAGVENGQDPQYICSKCYHHSRRHHTL